jgi:Big-like domain-containing protein
VRASSAVIIRSLITAVLGAVALTSACTKDERPSVTLNGVTVSGGSTATVGQTVQFSATANFSDNTTQNVTATAAWESSNNAIATVSSAGVATGVAAGSAEIRARFQDRTGAAPLAVTAVAPPPPPPDINPIARFTVTGPNAGDNDVCRLTPGGDINCTFDGGASTGGAGGNVNQWSWRFDVGANSGGPTAVNSPTFNPSTDCNTYFKVKPSQTGPGFTQMVVKLVVRNAAGVLSAEVVNNNIRLFPNNACQIGF